MISFGEIRMQRMNNTRKKKQEEEDNSRRWQMNGKYLSGSWEMANNRKI